MADRDALKALSEGEPPKREEGPLGLYSFMLFVAAFLVLSPLLILLAALSLAAPPPAILSWIAALVATGVLAVMALLLLIWAWLKAERLGQVAALVLIVAWIAVMGYFFDAGREMAAVLTLLSCVGLAVALFLGGLHLVSGLLLPTAGPDDLRRPVFKFLLDWIQHLNYPCYVVTDEPREEDKIVRRIPGNPFTKFAGGPGFIISDCDHAVVVSDGVKFKGVQGPGVTSTTFADRPVRTIDLRPQLRTYTVQGLTQDGIRVQVLFFAPFQVDPAGRRPQLGQPLPYRRSAAFKAVHAQKLEHPGERGKDAEKRGWDELPVLIGRRIMQEILSQYRFDELYDPFDNEDALPRKRIAAEFLERLGAELKPIGIHLVGGGISNLEPVDAKVLEQRVRSWQADWTRQVMLKQARSQTERLRRVEQARAEAQTELILAVGERLAELDRAGAQVSPEQIVSQFLEILEQLALQPALRRYIPRDTARDVRRLRAPFEEP